MTGNINRQRGVTLIVVLILVLLVTLAGIAAVRSLVVEERMAANSLDRSLAMQSLENALRYAEGVAQAQSTSTTVNNDFTPATTSGLPNGSYSATACNADKSDPSPCTAAGLCSQPTLGCALRSESGGTWATWTPPATGGDSALATAGVQYLIEFMGDIFACGVSNDPYNCSQYRITVRSASGGNRAFVQLQSTYLAFPK
jgi:type IV pilus assembly protein PilX